MSDIKEIENLMRAIGKEDSDNPDIIDHKLINADALFEKYSKEFRETPNALTRTKLLMIIEAIMFWTNQSKKTFSITEDF